MRKVIILFVMLNTTFLNFFIPKDALANDALTIPKDVFRLTFNTSIISIEDEYDSHGDKVKLGTSLGNQVNGMGIMAGLWGPGDQNPQVSPKIEIIREDYSLEYGIADGVNFLLQIPTYPYAKSDINPNADMSRSVAMLNTYNIPGSTPYLFNQQIQDGERSSLLGDIMTGFKISLFNTSGQGADAIVPNTFRGALAFGVGLPTGRVADPSTTDIDTTKAGAESYILGLRTYWDYQVNEYFFINLSTEHEYRFKGDYRHLNIAPDGLSYEVQEIKYKPGIYHYYEVEFALMFDITPTTQFWSGVYFTGSHTDEGEYSDYPSHYTGSDTQDSSQAHYIKPYIGFYTKLGRLPISLQLSYSTPFSGFKSRNTAAIDIVEIKLRAYLKF